jgi:hypothetical protein
MTDEEFRELPPRLTPRMCTGCTATPSRFMVSKTPFMLVGIPLQPSGEIPSAPMFVSMCENCGVCALFSLRHLGVNPEIPGALLPDLGKVN